MGPVLIGLAVLLAATGCKSSGINVGSASSGPPSAASRSLVDCQNVGQVRPSQFVLACADGGELLTGMTWGNWGATATGTGTERVNDCTPNCAEGTFGSFPVRVTLSGAASPPVGQAGQRYTTMTIDYPGRRPPVYNSSGSTVPGPSTRVVQLWGPSAG